MPQDTAHFARLLSSELDTASELHTLLQQELDALNSGNSAALGELNPAKQQLLMQLRQQASERLTWMSDQQLPHSSECLQRKDIATQPEIIRLWHMLSDAYEHNRDLSARLAEVVLALRFRTQQKLKILHAQHNDPHLYNEKGKASGVSRGYRSIEA